MQINNNKIYKAYYEIKQSKFYTYLFTIKTQQEFDQQLKLILLDHKKIDHVCYYYQYDDNDKNIIRFNESTEPKRTFYYPINQIVQKNKLSNFAIIVLRKFGGIKLGIGPLSRSYVQGVKEIIKEINNC